MRVKTLGQYCCASLLLYTLKISTVYFKKLSYFYLNRKFEFRKCNHCDFKSCARRRLLRTFCSTLPWKQVHRRWAARPKAGNNQFLMPSFLPFLVSARKITQISGGQRGIGKPFAVAIQNFRFFHFPKMIFFSNEKKRTSARFF